MKKEYNIM